VNGQPGGTSASGQWTGEVLVTPALAAELVGEQFPALRGAPVTELATGWDNTVYLLASKWVVRFPRRQVAVAGVWREIAALPRLALRLPLPVPVPELVGRPSARYPWPFWGARVLPGRELAESGLPESERTAAATAVGEFLRALHDPGLASSATDLELAVDPMRRADAAARAPKVREIVGRLVGLGVWTPDRGIDELLDRAEASGPVPAARAPALAHGDFHPRHLLVDAAGRATGVIDWGDLCLADPAVDLSIAYSGFAGPARAELLAAYGPVSAGQELSARTLAVFLCAALAEYAAAENRVALLRESLGGMRRAVAG
jgi:aminoglycoside phosphotransferase (APT) family kinase protein